MSTIRVTHDNERETWVRVYSPKGEKLEERYRWRSKNLSEIYPELAIEKWEQEDESHKLVLFKKSMLTDKRGIVSRQELISLLQARNIAKGIINK